jgi:hypothetical protein
MATITNRGAHQFQAQVRAKGYPTQCKTFETSREAKAWVAVIKSEQVSRPRAGKVSCVISIHARDAANPWQGVFLFCHL